VSWHPPKPTAVGQRTDGTQITLLFCRA
jgi:hypothetical protein